MMSLDVHHMNRTLYKDVYYSPFENGGLYYTENIYGEKMGTAIDH